MSTTTTGMMRFDYKNAWLPRPHKITEGEKRWNELKRDKEYYRSYQLTHRVISTRTRGAIHIQKEAAEKPGHGLYIFNLRCSDMDIFTSLELDINGERFDKVYRPVYGCLQRIYDISETVIPFDLTADHGVDISSNNIKILYNLDINEEYRDITIEYDLYEIPLNTESTSFKYLMYTGQENLTKNINELKLGFVNCGNILIVDRHGIGSNENYRIRYNWIFGSTIHIAKTQRIEEYQDKQILEIKPNIGEMQIFSFQFYDSVKLIVDGKEEPVETDNLIDVYGIGYNFYISN